MSYQYYIGIDISKDSFDVACHTQSKKAVTKFSNDLKGFKTFVASLKSPTSDYFITLEATGGYEKNLLSYLSQKGFAIHRLQTLKSSHYMRSLRVFGKSDILDAQALARFGAERHDSLSLYIPPSEDMAMLQSLRMRRDDFLQMRMAEKQRLKHPTYQDHHQSIKELCQFLTQQIDIIDKKISDLIEKDKILQQKKKIMLAFKGVGEQTSHTLLVSCPELGALTRRQIASLAGVAPHPKESGLYQGYRSTKGGRSVIKKALFMAALSAKAYNPVLKEFYNRLVERGKKKMVALTATMRKMIVILNAQIRDAFLNTPHITSKHAP